MSLPPTTCPYAEKPTASFATFSAPDCNPFSDITDIRGLHPTSKQCYEVLKAQWPAVIQWYGKLFPHFTPPYTTTDPEVYALKIVLWLWIIHFSASVLSYNSQWQGLVAFFNSASLNWSQLLAWGGDSPSYLACGRVHSLLAGFSPSDMELALFNRLSTICMVSGCGFSAQCMQAVPGSVCALP